MISLPDPFKRGDTFKLPFSVTDPEGKPQNITNWSIRSHLRANDGSLVQVFSVNMVSLLEGAADIYAAPADTAQWPVGFHVMDIEITDHNGDVYSTMDVQVPVGEGPTRD